MELAGPSDRLPSVVSRPPAFIDPQLPSDRGPFQNNATEAAAQLKLHSVKQGFLCKVDFPLLDQ